MSKKIDFKGYALFTISLLLIITASFTGCLTITIKEVKWGTALHSKDIGTTTDYNNAIDRTLDLGMKYWRFDIEWSELEPTKDNFDNTKVEYYQIIIHDLNSYGIEFFAVLLNPPEWAQTLFSEDKAEYWNQWAEFVEKVGAEYGDDIYYYQIDNEMNHIVGTLVDRWLYPVTDRPKVIEYAGEALNKVDSSYKTVVNVMANSPNWYTNLEYWLMEAGEHIDIIGLDHYPDTWTAKANKWRPLNIVLAETVREGSYFYDKEVAITEFGYSTWNLDTNTEINQQKWIITEIQELKEIIEAFNEEYGRKICFVIWYELIDSCTSPEDLYPEHHFGILRDDWNEKLGYNDLQTQIKNFNLED